MKTLQKFLFISAVALTITSISFASGEKQADNGTVATEQCYTCRYDQCHAISKSTGQRCRHCVSYSGDIYCWQHQ
jgi:hypothetical protein